VSVAPEDGRNRIMIYGPKNDSIYVVELPAPIGAAICASRTPTPGAGMGSKRRAKNERRSSLILSPARLRGFFFRSHVRRSSAAVATSREGHRWPSFHRPLKRVADGILTTRRGALGASCSQQRPAHYVNGQIGLRHIASTTARGASDRNLYQGGLQAMALHVAHDMSYRS
jgi:hypothetical protein